MLIIVLLAVFSVVDAPAVTSSVKKTTSAESTDLSKINWNEEPEKKTGEGAAIVGWEDDDTKEKTAEEKGLASIALKVLKKTEAGERITHIAGFFLFIFYIFGGVLTAYFTRDRKIAVHFPPELLILLHSVWPLEILLLPFFGRKVR